MRLLLATMSHETNTFSPVPTKLDRFCRDGTTCCQRPDRDRFLPRHRHLHGRLPGGRGRNRRRGRRSGLRQRPAQRSGGPRRLRDVLPPDHRRGRPGRFRRVSGSICTARWWPNGSMTARANCCAASAPSIRSTPLCVAYDMHANMFPAMVSNAQIVTGYQTYPHIDQRQTAERAARALLRVMRREVKPTRAWGSAPMLPHVMAQGTHQAPNKDLQAMCAAWEAQRTRPRGQPVRRLPACRCRNGRPVGGRGHRQRSRPMRRRWWMN